MIMLTRLLTQRLRHCSFLLTRGICWFPLRNWLTQAHATQGFACASLLWHNSFNSHKGRFWKMLKWPFCLFKLRLRSGSSKNCANGWCLICLHVGLCTPKGFYPQGRWDRERSCEPHPWEPNRLRCVVLRDSVLDSHQNFSRSETSSNSCEFPSLEYQGLKLQESLRTWRCRQRTCRIQYHWNGLPESDITQGRGTSGMNDLSLWASWALISLKLHRCMLVTLDWAYLSFKA